MEHRLLEELHDVVEYCKMSKESPCEMDKKIFKDIARDEYSHAKHIAEMMKRHGEYVEPTTDWEIATHAIEHV